MTGPAMLYVAPHAFMAEIQTLMALAHRPDPNERGRLYTTVADLIIERGETLSGNERRLSRQVLSLLTRQVETKVRRALALRLADRPDVPHDLILMLASDKVTVAEPVLINSPLLSEADLVLIVRRSSAQHLRIVARRPHLGGRVSEALIEHGSDTVVSALLANQTATIPVESLRTLVNRAARNLTLHDPLVHRRDLPPEIAARLYGMVSAALKAHIEQHYALDPAALAQDLTAAMRDAESASLDTPRQHAIRLIDKLEQANTLGPAFLVKAANEGQREIFIHGFARLLQCHPEAFERLLSTSDLRPFALAARAIAIDQSVVPSLIRSLRKLSTPLSREEHDTLNDIYDRFTPALARTRLTSSGLAA